MAGSSLVETGDVWGWLGPNQKLRSGQLWATQTWPTLQGSIPECLWRMTFSHRPNSSTCKSCRDIENFKNIPINKWLWGHMKNMKDSNQRLKFNLSQNLKASLLQKRKAQTKTVFPMCITDTERHPPQWSWLQGVHHSRIYRALTFIWYLIRNDFINVNWWNAEISINVNYYCDYQC